jgi:hypothetical protein
VIVFRNTDVDVPFFWEDDHQPSARWHGDGEGPAQYLASTPSAAWAEFLRHAGIDTLEDLAGVERAMWAIEIPDQEPTASPGLALTTLTGDPSSYPQCQAQARMLRAGGATRLLTPSAATVPGTPSGLRTDDGLRPAPVRDELTVVLFGARPELVGWFAAMPGRPEPEILDRVRPIGR